MHKTPQRRYVKVEFFGYAPVDLAIQLHLLGKKTDVNMVGKDMQPYLEYNGEYDKLHKPEVDNNKPLDVKQDGGNGLPPTDKSVGIRPTIL